MRDNKLGIIAETLSRLLVERVNLPPVDIISHEEIVGIRGEPEKKKFR